MAFQGQLRMGGGVSILFSLLAKSSTMGESPLFCLHKSYYQLRRHQCIVSQCQRTIYWAQPDRKGHQNLPDRSCQTRQNLGLYLTYQVQVINSHKIFFFDFQFFVLSFKVLSLASRRENIQLLEFGL